MDFRLNAAPLFVDIVFPDPKSRLQNQSSETSYPDFYLSRQYGKVVDLKATSRCGIHPSELEEVSK